MGAAVVYATSDDLATWLGTSAPTNAAALLRSASFTVALACQRDPYNDTPTSEAVDALRDATLAQASLWVALGVNPDAAGLDQRLKKSSKIGTASVDFQTLTPQEIQQAITQLAPQASAILTAAGLIWQPGPVGADPCDQLPHYGLSDQRGYGWLDPSVDWGDYTPLGFPADGTILTAGDDDLLIDGGGP